MIKTEISIYGLMIVLSILCGSIVIYINLKKEKYKKEEMIGLIIYIVAGTIFGGKYFTFFTNFREFKGIFNFNSVGLSSYGAVIGIILMLIIFSKQFKKKITVLIYTIIPSIPLMYGIGKIGCFISGCCYGIKYSGPFKIIYNYSTSAPKGVGLFPIQLLESIIFIGIYIYINKQYKKNKNKLNIIGQTFIICGIFKFMLDFLRIIHETKLITINQVVSIIFLIAGMVLVYKSNNNNVTDPVAGKK